MNERSTLEMKTADPIEPNWPGQSPKARLREPRAYCRGRLLPRPRIFGVQSRVARIVPFPWLHNGDK